MAEQEQVIAAVLHRSANGTVDRIVFNGDTYVRRNTVPPPDPNLAGYVGDWSDDYVAEATKNVDAAVAHSRAVLPLPPELLTPDPDLMASPEGDVKGLRELQDAARAAAAGVELHTATVWATLRGYRIMDPDGWRTPDAPPFDALIDEGTFVKHLGMCTIGPLDPNMTLGELARCDGLRRP